MNRLFLNLKDAGRVQATGQLSTLTVGTVEPQMPFGFGSVLGNIGAPLAFDADEREYADEVEIMPTVFNRACLV